MKLLTSAAFAVLASLVAATTDLDITAVASFPPTNELAYVTNGQRNLMTVDIENKSPVNVTLKSAAGSLHDVETGKLIKNTTTLAYGVPLLTGAKTILPYNFYSEHKPQDVVLKIWVTYEDDAKATYHVTAFDSAVTIVEPPSSFFDPQLLASYAMLALILCGSGYLLFQNFAPKSLKKAIKKQRRTGTAAPSKAAISEPIGVVKVSSSTGGYEEEWIPAHHKPKAAKKEKEAGLTSASSGDESGPEKKARRKASKRS